MIKNLLLTCIVLIAVVLRFFYIGENPPSLTWDEVAWGYNAYSLGLDGKDEFGRFLPTDYLESFGDFKPPIYAYLDIIPIKIFGLNEFAVRFPSAVFGTLTVLITYLLVKVIFQEGKTSFSNKTNNTEILALLTAFLLAISPWHINLSRAAFEANVASFFIVLGVFLFLQGIYKQKWYLIFSVISFVLSFYTFNTARIVAPLLIFGLGLGFRKKLLEQKIQVFMAIAVGIIMLLPTLGFMLTPYASLRFKEVNIFSDIKIIERTNQEMVNNKNSWFSKIFNNRRIAFTQEYVKHYLDHFNPRFLFITGDVNPKFSTQDVGQMYIWELPFFILGIIYLLKNREQSWWIIPFWVMVAIVPAATARETPHALRIETALPTFQILTAYGIVIFLQKISIINYNVLSIRLRSLVVTLMLIVIILNISYYLHGYYNHYRREYSGEWQYEYEEVIDYVRSEEDKYDVVYQSTSLGRPYIYYLFYLQTDPDYFRKTAIVEREVFGFVKVKGFGRYRFSENLGSENTKGKKILFIDAASHVPQDAKILKKFYLLNGIHSLSAYTI